MVHQDRKKDADLLFNADYVLGADGKNGSPVRRMMRIRLDVRTWSHWEIL